MLELVGRRNWNSNTVLLNEDTMETELHGGWVNYKREDGNWETINCLIEKADEKFEVTEAPFYFSAPLTSSGEAFFESNNRYDIFAKEDINDESAGMYIKAPTAVDVPGELFDINGDGRLDAVIYRGAFPDWDADLIYFVQHGRAPRLQKLVRFNSYMGVGDIQIPFELRYTKDMFVKPKRDFLTRSDEDRVKKHKDRMRRHFRKDTKEGFKKGMVAMLDMNEAQRTVWSESDNIRTDKSMMFRSKGAISRMRGFGMKDYFQWDSGKGKSKKKEKIEVEMKKIGPLHYQFTKHVTDSFLRVGTYPCFTDTTTTVYPDPDTESTSVDGFTAPTESPTWANVHDDVGTSASDTGTEGTIRCDKSTGGGSNYNAYRMIALFDATAIDDTDSLSAAVLSLYANSTQDNQSDSIGIVRSAPASNTAIVAGDHDSFTVDSDTAGATKTLAAHSTGAYNAFTLDATGRGWVSFSVVTKLGARLGLDYAETSSHASAPTTSTNSVVYRTADTSGTSSDPKLVLTHAATAPADPTNPTCVATSDSNNLTVGWDDNSSNESAFHIERSNDGSTGWTEIGTTAADATSYVDSTVGARDTKRYYRVRAFRNDESLYSSYTSVVNATTAPADPTSSACANADDSNTLTITWTDNSSTESTYRIERSNTGSGGWAEIGNVAAGVTTYDDDVAARDTQKYYRVRALRAGDTKYSGYDSTVNNFTAPADPTMGVITISGATGSSVPWTDNSSSENTFRIERRAQDEASFTDIAGDTTSPYIDSGLTAEKKYFYRIRAHNTDQSVYSGYSAEDSIQMVPAVPTNLQCLPTGDVTGNVAVHLLWDVSSIKHTGIKIERSNDDAAWATVTTTAAGITEYEDSGLTIGNTYYYRVSAVGPDGNSAVTSSVSVVATQATKAGLTHAFLKKLGSFPRQ